MVEAQDVPIVRRVCPGCSRSHKDLYYRRLSDMPEEFDLLDTLMNNWVDTDNKLNKDFAIYSNHLDAYYDVNRWEHCNFNDLGIGFPRDCGPNKLISNNWNSYYRDGGQAQKHAFLLPVNPNFTSKLSNIALGDVNRRSTVHQQGISNGGTPERALDGDTVGIYNWGGTTQSNEQQDPYWQVELQHNSTINKVYIWRCVNGCRQNNRLFNIRVEVYDHMYGDVVDSRYFEGGEAKKLKVVDFGEERVKGQVVRITSETAPGQRRTLSLAEVEIAGTLGPAIDHEIHAEVDADEYSDAKGIGMGSEGKTVHSIDVGDYITYGSLNFGPSGTTKSLLIRYAKHGTASRSLEIRLGGSTGELIGKFFPSNTGGWSKYVDAYALIKDVEGIHDVTFVGRGGRGVMNLESFDLSNIVQLKVFTAYKIDNDKARARDVQCRYSTLLDAYTKQVYDTVSDKSLSIVQEFNRFLDVGDDADAAAAALAVDALCKSAQDTVKDDK